MTTIKERVLQIAEYYGITKGVFFEELSLSYANFKGIQKKSALSSDAIDKIITKYEDVNLNWLITGRGEMFITKEEVLPFKLRTDSVIDKQLIPLYNLEASAGLVNLFQNKGDVSPIDHLQIPNLPKCDGAVFVTGDSMYPLLKSGDIVAFKEIDDLPNNIFWGEMYIVSIDVCDEEYVAVKYVQKSELGPEYISLVSQNQHHATKDVLLSKVRAMAIVKASVRINSMR